MAKLTFFGATDGVTGSAYLIETDRSRLLLECGIVQGSRRQQKANREPFPFDVASLDAVVISHAHLDHSGRLPKLVSDGYTGSIIATHATHELLEIMLKDAAFLEQRDVDWKNRRLRRAGKPEIEPVFTIQDVEATLKLREGCTYGSRTTVADGIDVTYRDAGHILGSSIVELFITENGVERKLVFSGDLGNSCAALLRDPELVESAHVLLLESTYGDRDHRPMPETLQEFETIISEALDSGG